MKIKRPSDTTAHDARWRLAYIVGQDRAMMQDGVRNWPEGDIRVLRRLRVPLERWVIGVAMDCGRQRGHVIRARRRGV